MKQALGLYWLMPPTKVSRRAEIQWAVLEELEMGLHPDAINVVLLMVLELLRRGYKVCVSTHATQPGLFTNFVSVDPNPFCFAA